MTINDLVYSMKRPVDLIEINTPDTKCYLFDGYEESIPLQILEMPVMNWEVTVEMKMQSMCEVKTVFALTIETEDTK